MRIGELAGLAGVSTRTVRHYHHLGLLPEPQRKANGYREYGLRDAVALARVRRLTELGLGLEEVRDVLADDAGRELREVLTELDEDLARQEEAIRARRARLAEVLRRSEEPGGLPEEGPVSEQLAEVFAKMARTSATLPGPEPAMAVREREVLALLDASGDGRARGAMAAALREMFVTPGSMERAYAAYGLLDELAGAAVDDPRVVEAARALVECVPDRVVAAIAAGAGPVADSGRATEVWAELLVRELAPAQAEAMRVAMRMIGEGTR
ncbi:MULTISPECIES: MerR family transcriptional regulator [Streptomyces]|uniref:MerR family transcriptional regulator n=2 Tax=Streptomyces TaxID=1883 RepID=A0A2N8PM34_STRNR|nr:MULTISPECIES: MerR family transcriptional regulator [Streptomyces]PNE42085.1 MerR family transcriptional regulator [Streptomyces noursei]SHN05174.1 DNA-binding transcriptional regulator, MerR family [Streptomyces yunnanensis]